MKKLAALTILALLVPGAASQLEVQVEPATCPSGTNPLVTIDEPNSTTGNPGGPQGSEPSLFRHKVCVGNVEAPTMRDSCPGTPGFYLHNRGASAHFSNTSVYPTEVCTGRLQVNLRSLDPDGDGAVEQQDPCNPGEQPLFSVSNLTNAHIGSPYNDFYRFKACGFLRSFSPESVQIRLSLDSGNQVRSDAESLTPGEERTALEYPYIASSDGSTVSGIVADSANTTIRRVKNGQNTLILTTTKQDGATTFSSSVFLPFTRGGFDSLESRDEVVMERELLSRRNPTFGFPNAESDSNLYRSYLDQGFNISNNMSLEPGRYQLELERTEEGEIVVETE